MKKTFILMALAAVSLVACQKEKTEERASRNIRIQAQTLTVPTKAGVGDDSRAQWSIGETAALVSLSDYSAHESAALTSEDITDAGQRASFSFSGIADGSYRLVSPKAEVSAEGVTFTVPGTQAQETPGISGNRLFLVGGAKGSAEGQLADITVGAESSSCEAYFRMAGALLRFNVFSSTAGGMEQIRSISVDAGATQIAGSMTVGLDGAMASVKGTGSEVTVSVGTPEIVVAKTAEEAKGIYACVIPAKIAANENGSVTYTITTDGSVYRFVSKDAKEWVEGAVNVVNIDLNSATKVERQAPIMSSTHPQTKGDFPMTEVEPGVYKLEHQWLSGQEYDIYFAAGTSGFYYAPVDPWVSERNRVFDLEYTKEVRALKIQSYDGKNYGEKYYTIILDTNTNRLSMIQETGERFWIVGDNLSWDMNKYEMTVDKAAGKATWYGWFKAANNFKIHGENMWAENAWKGPNNYDGSGEWYFRDDSRENGISLNSDGLKQWSCEAGYHKVTFDYKADPMTISIEKVESLELTVNGTAMTYKGNNEYTATLELTKGEPVTFAGCNDLEYVRQDPDFLKDGKFNSKTGTYTVVLHLGTRESSWSDSDNQVPNSSWTIFRSANNGGVYSTLFLCGEGVAPVTIKNCVGWNVEGDGLAFMAEIDDKVYQFTGRYREQWWQLEPYDRWTNNLNFKYFGNVWWNGGIVNGVTLDDKTGKVTQGSDGNLRWADSGSKWDDYGYYRMTVNMNTTPQTVTFEKL